MKEFEPKKKFKFGKMFFYKYVYVGILGLMLLLGVGYGLTFFVQNYKVGEGKLTTASLTVNYTNTSINATNLVSNTDNLGINEFSKILTLTNTTATKGKVRVNLERTSGLALTDLRYALIISGTDNDTNYSMVYNIGDVPASGLIFESAIMEEEVINIEVRLWPKSSYTGSLNTFTGSLNPSINLMTMTAANYIKSTRNIDNTLTISNDNYYFSASSTKNNVYFNCSDMSDTSTCEVWKIVGVESNRLILTRSSDYTNGSSRTNSNLYNSSLNFNDNSLITSVSTDNKNVYLLTTTQIVGGNGTSASPYILGNDINYVNDFKKIATITYMDNATTIGTQPIYYGINNYISEYLSDAAFGGWSTTNGGAVAYRLGDSITLTNNTNLYAYKVINAVNLGFDNTITNFDCTDAQCALEDLNDMLN